MNKTSSNKIKRNLIEVKEKLLRQISDMKKVAIMGVGNDLRGDDAAGLEVVRTLKLSSDFKNIIQIIDAGSVPENYSELIREFRATHLIIIDAAVMNGYPGEIRLIDEDQIGDVFISTHRLPLNLLSTFLKNSTGTKTIFIGIQPKSVGFGETITEEVSQSVKLVVALLKEVVEEIISSNSNKKQ